MSYLGDFLLGSTVSCRFTTVQSTGAPTTLSGSPVISCYPSGTTTEITSGITLTADYDSRTGFNNVAIVASGGNTFAVSTDYDIVITTGTVNSVSVVGYVVGTFSIQNRFTNVAQIGGQTASAAGTVTFPGTIASTTNITAGTITTVTTVTNQLTAAAIATGVWQDAVSGDFTTASSIGKSLYTSGVVPGGTNGLFIAGTNAATTITTALTTTFTGNLTGTVASVVGAVGSVTGNVGGNVVGSTASVVGAVGSVTGNVGGNVTGSVGSVVGAVASVTGAVGSVTGNVGGNVVGSVASVSAAVTITGDLSATMKTSVTTAATAATPAVTVSNKTGFSLTSAYDPAKTAVQTSDLDARGLTTAGVTRIAGHDLADGGMGGQLIGAA